ncbi:hypothetical protein N8457_00120 [bacterium]|nr:hypothetical protein [bacterium]
MADEKKLLPVIGLDQTGIIKDVPGHILPPNAFTDGKNVFFKNSSVQKRKGTIKAVDNATAIVATVSSTAGNTMTFDVDPALTVNSEFTIANANPSSFNGTYNVTAVSDSGKTVTVSQTLGVYTSGGTYTFTPKIDFIDYWPAPNAPQYIEVQQNDSATPAAPVFNSIRSTGNRERISLKSYEVEGITSSTTPTITIDGDPFNLTQYNVSGVLEVKPVVEREIKAGETLKVFGANPNTYDGAYVVTGITYNTGTTKTEISCSSASVDTSSLAAYNTDSAELRRDTFSPTSYLGITSQDWQSAFFAGGYAYVINDGYHTPHYLLASLGANYVTPQLTPLPGWDWQRYLGEEVHAACKVIRGYKDTLIAGNFSFYPITAGVPALNPSKSSPGTIRISRTAAPGEIPTSWQPALTEAFVEERELSTTSAIMDIVALQGTAMVYTTDSIHSITYDSRGNVSDQVVAEGYGALETGCVLEFDGKHIVIGADDIYMFGGHPGSIQSICDGKIRNYFYDNLSPTPAYLDNIFMIRDTSMDEIHIYYPTKLSPNGFCDEYLAWNYRNNTWTINECNNLVSGTLAPVRGGGVAGGEVTFAGIGNTTAAARTEQQKITVDLTADYPAGTVEVQTLDYSASNTTTASTYSQEELTITIPSEIIPFSEEIVEFDFHDSFDSGASSRDIGTTTGSGATSNIANTTIDLQTAFTTTSTNLNGPSSIDWIIGVISSTTSGEGFFVSATNEYVPNSNQAPPVPSFTTNTTKRILITVSSTTINYDAGSGSFIDPRPADVVLLTSVVENSVTRNAVAGIVTLSNGNTMSLETVNQHSADTSSGIVVYKNSFTFKYSGSTDPNNITKVSFTVDGKEYTVERDSASSSVDTEQYYSGGLIVLSNSTRAQAFDFIVEDTKVVYSLNDVLSGSDIDLVVDGVTLTETNLSHTFDDTNTNRSWSLTGTVPVIAHSGTTNSDGTLATGSGTTSPTDISGFVGFNLTEQEILASAKTDSGSGSYPRLISHSGSDGTIARTVTVQENPAASPATQTFASGTGFSVSPGFSFGGVNNANTVTIVSNGFSYRIFNVTASLASLNGPINYSTSGGTFIGSGSYFANTGTISGTGTSVVFTGYPTSITYTISSESQGTNWTDNAATIDSSTGVVSFPTQYKTKYTLTNGSSTTIAGVDLIVGGITVTDSSFAPGDTPLTISFGDSGSARAWSVSPGSAATFALAGDGAFPDLSARSFPANVGAATAVAYAAGVIDGSSTAVRAQAKASDNTVLQVFYPNADLAGTNTNITLTLAENDGSNVTADGSTTSTGTRTAQGQFFTQYRVQIQNNNSDEIINITPTFNSSNITLSGAQNTFASAVGVYLKDQIIAAVNASGFMTNEPDWYDNGSSGSVGSDYVIKIGSGDIENYSTTLTNINTTNVSYPGATSGINNTFSFFDTLTSDSLAAADTLVVKSPTNTTITSLTTRSGETIDSVMSRVAAAIQADTNDGWGASHDAANDTITFTATAQGRYPVVYGNGAPADLVYTDYAVIKFDYTQGTSLNSLGNIPDINASITTQGSDEAVKLTIVDPSRENNNNTGPFEDVFEAAGTTSEDIANSIKARMDLYWSNWTTTVTDTGVASSGSGNKFDVNLTSVASDWVLKNRVTPGITANDVVYPTDRAVFVKKVEYGSGVTGSSSSATAGTNFDAASNKSTNFVPSDVRIGYPTINPTSVIATVIYENKETLVETPVVQSVTLTSAGNSDSMAAGLASVLNSSAVPALSASASGSVMTITTNDLTQRIKSFSFTFDEQTTQGGRNSVSRTNGNNIAGSGAVPTSSFVGVDNIDDDRPYPTNEFNLNKFYPLVANQTSILAEGFGYTFNADPPNDVAGTPYSSFVERIQLPIDNSVEYKKNVSYVQALIDEGNVLVKFKGSDSPGEQVNLSSLTGKVFDYDGEYKLDFRENGRVFNIRIEDATASNIIPWRLSGYGIKVEAAESRGRT